MKTWIESLVVILGIILVLLIYTVHTYKTAATGLITLANQSEIAVNSDFVSFSFMIPQMFWKQYIEQVTETIRHIDEIHQQHIYIVLRVKSLGPSLKAIRDNFWTLINTIKQKRKQSSKQISIVLSGLFGIYNDLEYQLFIEALDAGIPDIFLTIQANRSISESKVKSILDKKGGVRLVKGYYKGDIKDRLNIHNNYMKLARILIESDQTHILGTHNLKKIKQLYEEYPNMNDHIKLGYLYYINDYFQNQLVQFPELRDFDIIPQIQTSELSTLSVFPYTLDALEYWNFTLLFNLMGVNKYFPKYENIPKQQA